jgi:hypothetical protein
VVNESKRERARASGGCSVMCRIATGRSGTRSHLPPSLHSVTARNL